jgi:hypothetical protein
MPHEVPTETEIKVEHATQIRERLRRETEREYQAVEQKSAEAVASAKRETAPKPVPPRWLLRTLSAIQYATMILVALAFATMAVLVAVTLVVLVYYAVAAVLGVLGALLGVFFGALWRGIALVGGL